MKLTLATDDGEVIEQFDMNDYRDSNVGWTNAGKVLLMNDLWETLKFRGKMDS